MLEQTLTRRRLIAAAGAAGLAGTAGCLGGVVGSGGGAGSQIDPWLVEPADAAADDHYPFALQRPRSLAEHQSEYDEDFYETLETDFSELSVDLNYSDVTLQLTYPILDPLVSIHWIDEVGPGVRKDLENAGYSTNRSVGDIDLYTNTDEATAYGLGTETILRSEGRGSKRPVTAIQNVAEAQAGDEDRYSDSSSHFKKLLGELGDGDLVLGGTQSEPTNPDEDVGRFDEEVADGGQFTVEGGDTTVEMVSVFDDGSDADKEAVEDWIEGSEENNGLFDEIENEKITRSGRVVTVEGVIGTDDLNWGTILKALFGI